MVADQLNTQIPLCAAKGDKTMRGQAMRMTLEKPWPSGVLNVRLNVSVLYLLGYASLANRCRQGLSARVTKSGGSTAENTSSVH